MANYGGRGYARRNEIARAKGFANYSAYRKATPAQRQRATSALAKRDASYAKSGAAAQAVSKIPPKPYGEPGVTDMGAAGRVLVSMVEAQLRRFVRQAEREGDRLYARAVIQVAGQGPREVGIWSKGGADPSWVDAGADGFGGVKPFIEDQISMVYGLEGAWRLVQLQLLRV